MDNNKKNYTLATKNNAILCNTLKFEVGASMKKTAVDTDYNKQSKMFSINYQQLPIKKQQLINLTNQLNHLKTMELSTMSNTEIETLHRLKNEIAILVKEIEEIEHWRKPTAFYLKTGRLLIDYYNQFEGGGTESSKKNSPEKNLSQDGMKSLTLPQNNLSSMTNFKANRHRFNIYEEYLNCTDPHHVTTPEYDENEEYCSKCGQPRELLPNEAIMVCPKCGDEVTAVLESDRPSYKDSSHEVMYYAYKRINHFKEHLSHFQARETTKIPQEVYDAILVEFKKEKHINLAKLKKSQVKRYLQKFNHLGYNKYYENINQIIYQLNGLQPLSMTPEVEEQLCNMFQKIQEPFERHCPKDRTNFLSYSYVIYKFCQLLGYYQYLPYFNLLKSKDKLHQQDHIWKKICSDLHWDYHQSPR